MPIPEDLSDPAGVVDPWLAGARSYDLDEEIMARGKVSAPTSLALECDAYELYRMLGEELPGSELFSYASYAATVAGVVGRADSSRARRPLARGGREELTRRMRVADATPAEVAEQRSRHPETKGA